MTKSGNRISPPPDEFLGDSKLPFGVEQLKGTKEKIARPCSLMEKNEYSICEAVRNGDRLAIEKAYLESLGKIAWHVEKGGGWWKRTKTSKDYAQDAWVILLTKLSTGFDCRMLPNRSFHAYLKEVAFHLFLKAERGIKRNQAYLDSLSMELVEDPEFDADKNDLLRKARLEWAMGQLSKEDRWVLERYYFDDMKHDVLSKTAGISNEAVRQRLSRARARLLEILEQMGINGTWI